LQSRREMLSSRHRALGSNGEVVHLQAHFRLSYAAAGNPVRLLGVAWDVSAEVEATAKAQNQAEERRALLERFRLAVQAADIHTWELDLQTDRFMWIDTDHLRQVIPVGSTIHEFAQRVHPEDLDVLPTALRSSFKERKEKIEYRYRTIEAGEVLHWQVQARLYRNHKDRVTRILGMTREITHEVNVAAQLEAQARHERILLERFTMATQTANICSWEIDLTTRRFLWGDNPIKTVNGVQDLSADTEAFLIRVHPDDRHEFNRMTRNAFVAQQQSLSWCYRDVAECGAVSHIQTHARITYDAAGSPLTMLGVSWDVTAAVESAEKLKQQAQLLHDAQRRLERASLSSSEGHWEADVLQQRLWFSSSYYALLGYQEGELSMDIGALDHLVHPDDLQAVRQAHQQHLEQGTSF